MQYLDLGATTVAVNVEGAAGYIGALQGYNSKNDGYTIMTHNEMDLISYTMSGQSAEPLYENLEYICDVVTDYNLLSTSPDTGWKTAQDVIDYVNANPGKVTRRQHRLQQRKLRHHHGAAQGHGHLRQGNYRSL